MYVVCKLNPTYLKQSQFTAERMLALLVHITANSMLLFLVMNSPFASHLQVMHLYNDHAQKSKQGEHQCQGRQVDEFYHSQTSLQASSSTYVYNNIENSLQGLH